MLQLCLIKITCNFLLRNFQSLWFFSYLFLYFSAGDKNLDREFLTCLWGSMRSSVESPALYETS